jgi:dihydropyrimidinase
MPLAGKSPGLAAGAVPRFGREMKPSSILIRGGRVVTAADDVVADVLVEGEQIAAVGALGGRSADRVVEAAGKLVLPGCVDVHTHLDMPLRDDVVTADDFLSGQTAAAFGGTTCHIDFATQARGSTLAEALEAWHGKRERRSIIDNGFHMAVTDLSRPDLLEELARLPEHGVTSFKLYLAYKSSLQVDDGVLFRAMRIAAEVGARVMVHAENGDVIDVLVADALAHGHISPAWHAKTRPPATEGEAVNRSIELAHLAGCHLYVVHVSCREALAPIEAARRNGWAVTAETCPQYLLLDSSYLDRGDFEGARYVFTPPPRTRADQDALWRACAGDVLSVVSTDHCSFTWEQKLLGRDDFSQIPNGGVGIETRLELVHTFGVGEGRISLTRMVDLLATTPAKLFGLYPRKGTIATGSDADLVIFDPAREKTISASAHHSRADYSMFEGLRVRGVPELVIRRGEVIVEGGRLLADPGSGRFVERARVGDRLEPQS